MARAPGIYDLPAERDYEGIFRIMSTNIPRHRDASYIILVCG